MEDIKDKAAPLSSKTAIGKTKARSTPK